MTGAGNEGEHRLHALDNRANWERALAGVPHTWGHTWTHAAVAPLPPEHTIVLYSWRSACGRLAFPLVVRPVGSLADVASPPGFSGPASSGDCSAWPAAWRAFAASQGWVCGYLSLSPVLRDPVGLRTEDAVERQGIFLLDLLQGPDALVRRMGKKRRSDLARWGAQARTWTDDRQRVSDFLEDRAPAFFRERGAAALSALPARAWRMLLADPGLHVQALVDREQVQAVGLLGCVQGTADYLFGMTAPGSERHSAGVLWTAAQRLADAGAVTVNLGGGISAGDGVEAFKRRFGANGVPLRALHQVYRQTDFERLCAQVPPRRPGGRSVFPPYRGE